MSSDDNIFQNFKENDQNILEQLARENPNDMQPNAYKNTRKSKNATTVLS